MSRAANAKASSFNLMLPRDWAKTPLIAQRRTPTAMALTNASFRRIEFIKSAGNVCLRRGSGKQYSLQRAVAQLGSALEWGSRGRGFKSRRPEKFLSHGLTRMKHRLCVVKIQIYPFKSVFICG